MRFYKKLLILGVASIVILLIIGLIKERGEESSVFTTPIKKGDLVIYVKARGEVLPSKEYKVSSLLCGVVDKILVEEGEEVRQGQLLLTIDKQELLLKLKESEKNIIACKNRLQEINDGLEIKRAQKLLTDAKLAFEDAKREYDSLSRLYEMKAIPLQKLENSQSNLLRTQENLRLSEKELAFAQRKKELELKLVSAQLKEAEYSCEWIKKQLLWAEVKSPINGVVIEKNQNILPNQIVSSGMHLFTIAPLSYKIKALIDEVDIGKIHIGQKAKVTIDAYPYNPFTSFIKNISTQPIISEKVGIRRFEVYLEDFSVDDINITPRMQCSIEMVKVVPNILKVSLTDVKEEGGRRYVFLIEGGRAKKRLIKTGLENEEEAEILSGLREGERIIKSPSLIKDGIKVNDKSSRNIKDLQKG